MLLFVNLSVRHSRIDCTADGAVDADAVSGTADVAGDTFADITDISKFNFIYPLRVRDQPASHTDEVCVSPGQDIVGYLRIADIAHRDTGLSIFFFYGLRHVGTPSVRQIIGVYLILD